MIGAESALSRSGRLSVSVATPSEIASMRSRSIVVPLSRRPPALPQSRGWCVASHMRRNPFVNGDA